MARYPKRRIIYRRRKYNIENRPLEIQVSNVIENGFFQNQTEIVPATLVEGVRQVARMTITLTTNADSNRPIFWALCYIPEGSQTSSLFPTTTTLFNPSNYVLSSGIADPSAGSIRISSRLKKNLNANDRIFLMTATTKPAASDTVILVGLVRYAICYN